MTEAEYPDAAARIADWAAKTRAGWVPPDCRADILGRLTNKTASGELQWTDDTEAPPVMVLRTSLMFVPVVVCYAPGLGATVTVSTRTLMHVSPQAMMPIGATALVCAIEEQIAGRASTAQRAAAVLDALGVSS